MRRTVALLLGGVWVLSGARAMAHDADIVFVQADPRGDGQVREVATLTGATLAILAPVDQNGDGVLLEDELPAAKEAIEAGFWESVPLFAGDARCARVQTTVVLKEGYVELSGEFRCPTNDALRQEFRILSVLPSGYRVVLGTKERGEIGQRFAEGRQQTLFLESRAVEGEQGPSGFVGWVLLGMEHIVTGYDHLAFLGALLLVASSWKRLLWMVTAFTLAHSITLGATALEWITLPPAGALIVEIAIAGSVVFVAVENLVGVHEKWRPALTFAFGLVHGFGFASVLASYGLGESAVAALAGFNIGVELGQAALIVALVPVLRLLRRREKVHRWVVIGGSLVIAAVGCYWFVTRLLG